MMSRYGQDGRSRDCACDDGHHAEALDASSSPEEGRAEYIYFASRGYMHASTTHGQAHGTAAFWRSGRGQRRRRHASAIWASYSRHHHFRAHAQHTRTPWRASSSVNIKMLAPVVMAAARPRSTGSMLTRLGPPPSSRRPSPGKCAYMAKRIGWRRQRRRLMYMMGLACGCTAFKYGELRC